MGGVVRAVGDAIGGVVRGVGDVVGGVAKGVGDLVTGHPLDALGDVVGGVAHGVGDVVHGGLSAVKDVVTDPIVDSVAGFALGGPLGLMAGPLVGQAAGSLIDGVDGAVGALTGTSNNNDFGPGNGSLAGLGGPSYDPTIAASRQMGWGVNYLASGGFGMGGGYGMGMGMPGMFF